MTGTMQPKFTSDDSIRAQLLHTTLEPLFVPPIHWNKRHQALLLKDIEEPVHSVATNAKPEIIKVEEFCGKFRQKHGHASSSVIDFITHRDGMAPPTVRLRMMTSTTPVACMSLVRMLKGNVPILAVLPSQPPTGPAKTPFMLGVLIAIAQEQAIFLPDLPAYRVSAVIGPNVYSTSISSEFLAAWKDWNKPLHKLVLTKQEKTAKNLDEVVRIALSILRPGLSLVQIADDDDMHKKPLLIGLKSVLAKKWHERNLREHFEI